jgi:predicted aldo/keto reductase-like oxidoreductase
MYEATAISAEDIAQIIGLNTDHEDSIRVIHRALDAGVNFVDTPMSIRRASLRRSSARR